MEKPILKIVTKTST